MNLRILSFALSFVIVALVSPCASTGVAPLTLPGARVVAPDRECAGNTDFRIGSGIYDITGPASGLGMMGYGQVGQRTRGIHFRLWSRAFVIESPCNGKRVVFVSADLGQLFQGVKQQVVERLRYKYGNLYCDKNVVLSATHNHAGPGGFSHYALYNLTILGFDRQNFKTIVDGVYQSIVRAHEDLAPGTIRIARGDLLDASRNRSREAYEKNPRSERERYAYDTDKQMTLLKFVRSDREAGLINWFPVHCTSMHNDNRLISGDNKGYAAYLFERLKTADYCPHTFVAAFAQSNEGDVTPNVCGDADGGGVNDVDSTRISGEKQYNNALRLYCDPTAQLLSGGVDYRHAYRKMDAVEVMPQYTDGFSHRTCTAALGFKMIAGAADGPGIGWLGRACDEHKFLWFICKKLHSDCQCEKPIIAEIGSKKPFPWSPPVLPIQLARIGNLVIIAVPGEFTTMAGRRLINTVMAQLAHAGVEYAVIAGLSNAYAGYVTTREEYAKQLYEGASTHFGPWTLAAYQQEFDRLALALRNGDSVDPGPPPLDLRHEQRAAPVHTSEWKPLWKHFGDVHRDTNAAYQPGQTVNVSFWAGHPRNDLKIQDTYLMVQRQDGSSWVTVARDRDWETRFIWRRSLLGSLATVEWTIPPGTRPGVYRIRHDGASRSHGTVVPYSGLSRTFTVGSP
ncbi:MAG: neutral/alkaline non-lysosomal ceramidase N-terminal domain-containing protein [Acidobacteriota bacterium]